jgi:beta-galactosidase
LSYYGLGPSANYVDRKAGTWMGVHASVVLDQYVPYVRPQDCGNHEEVRWLELKSPAGFGLRVVAPEPLAMSALPYTQEELDAAMHTIDLPETPTSTELRVAAKVSGLGNKSCGPLTDPQYRATAEPVEYRFVLKPFAE